MPENSGSCSDVDLDVGSPNRASISAGELPMRALTAGRLSISLGLPKNTYKASQVACSLPGFTHSCSQPLCAAQPEVSTKARQTVWLRRIRIRPNK